MSSFGITYLKVTDNISIILLLLCYMLTLSLLKLLIIYLNSCTLETNQREKVEQKSIKYL